MHLDALKAEVAANTQVIQSAITLIEGLAAKIEELKNDPVELQNLVDELHSTHSALADAVSANTDVPPV